MKVLLLEINKNKDLKKLNQLETKFSGWENKINNLENKLPIWKES